MNSPEPLGEQVASRVAELLTGSDTGVLPIVQAGHPVLRQVAEPYEGQLGSHWESFLAAMRRTMHAAPGVGLAAPQIAVGLAVAVIEDPGVPDGAHDPRERPSMAFRVLVNPRYDPVGDERVSFYEGCLSAARWHAVRARFRSVRLRCLDENGTPVDEVLTGWPARIVQHEVDHLNGELYLDAAEPRSLTSDDNLAQWWAHGAGVHLAARTLGFPLDAGG